MLVGEHLLFVSLSEHLLFAGTHGDGSSQQSYRVIPVHTSAGTSELTFTLLPSLTFYMTLCLFQMPPFSLYSPVSNDTGLAFSQSLLSWS